MSPRPARPRVSALAVLSLLLVWGCSDESNPDLVGPQEPGAPGPPAVLVVNGQSETLSRLDLSTGALQVQAAVLGSAPNRIRPVPGGRELLVTSSGTNELELFGAADLSRLTGIDLGVGRSPWLAVPLSDSVALVSNWASSDVALVDLRTGQVSPPLPTWAGPEGFLVHEDRAFVACTNFQAENSYGEGRLDIVNLSTWALENSVPVGTNPQDVARDSSGRIHVLCTGNYQTQGPGARSGTIHVLTATGEPVDVIELGGAPGRIVIDDQNVGWIAGFAGGVRRYDASSLEVLSDPPAPLDRDGYSSVDVDELGDRIYLTNFDLDLLVAVERFTLQIADTWTVGDGPVDVRVVRGAGDGR